MEAKTRYKLRTARASGALTKWLESRKYYPCATSVAVGSCSHGHNYGKLIACGREWCEYCGENNSLQHQTRAARWLHKVNQCDELGYFVVTIPSQAREMFMQHETLSNFRRAVVRYLKRSGFERGLVRYHWCGDCPDCKGEGCDKCDYKKTGKTWHPHLNILTDTGYISKEKLHDFKAFVAKWMRNNTPYNGRDAVIHYQYTSDEKKKAHLLRYVTRSTLRFDWITYKDKRVVDTVKKYRASISFGSWESVKLDDIRQEKPDTALAAGCCPKCSENGKLSKLKYPGRPVSLKDVNTRVADYREGWYYFPDGDMNKYYADNDIGHTVDWSKYFARDLYEYNLIKVLQAHRPMYGDNWYMNKLYEHGFLSKMIRVKKKGKFVLVPIKHEATNRYKQANIFNER